RGLQAVAGHALARPGQDLAPGLVELGVGGGQLVGRALVELPLVAVRVAADHVVPACQGRGAGQQGQDQQQGPHPTEPSRLTSSSFLASTANSIGSSRKTCLQKPSTISETASSSEMPRLRQ